MAPVLQMKLLDAFVSLWYLFNDRYTKLLWKF